jgi:acetyltransferase-like isoleucine patch superfamily enzyme
MADLRVERVNIHPSAKLAKSARIVAHDLRIEEGVRIGERANLMGSRIHLAAGSEVANDVEVLAIEELFLGRRGTLGPGLRAMGRRLRFGAYFWSTRYVVIGGGGSQGPESKLEVGDHSSLFDGAYINLSEAVTIGRGCALSVDTVILTHSCWQPVLEGYPYRFAPVTMGDDVVVYVKAVILPGVNVGRGTVVAAGSIVCDDTPFYSLVGGVPARVLRTDVRRKLRRLDREELVRNILSSYASTLAWKGARLLASPSPQEIALEYDGTKILVRVEGGIPLRLVVEGEGNGVLVFDFDSMTASGVSGPVGEDLRDHLRRSGVKLFTGQPFRALTPAPLVQLRELSVGRKRYDDPGL